MIDRLGLERLTAELCGILKAIEDLNRRVSAVAIKGKVAEIDGDYVRLELGRSKDGRPFLSPKVLVQEMAGATASKFPVAVGDPMMLFSPHGEPGPASLAIRDAYTDQHPRPGDGKELALEHEGSRVRIGDGALRLEGRDEASVSPGAGRLNLGGDGSDGSYFKVLTLGGPSINVYAKV
jgi:hypothetical protein